MSEPLDHVGVGDPEFFIRMIWRAISAGVRWGALLGAGYGCVIGFLEGPVLFAIITTVVGAVLGAIYGLVMGGLHGLMSSLITMVFFSPLGDERIYRGAMAVTSLLVNLGVGYWLVTYYGYGVPRRMSSGDMVFFGWPLLIETVVSLMGSQLLALWYSDECF